VLERAKAEVAQDQETEFRPQPGAAGLAQAAAAARSAMVSHQGWGCLAQLQPLARGQLSHEAPPEPPLHPTPETMAGLRAHVALTWKGPSLAFNSQTRPLYSTLDSIF